MISKRGDLVFDDTTISLQLTSPCVESYKIFGMEKSQNTKYALFYNAIEDLIEKKHIYWVKFFPTER